MQYPMETRMGKLQDLILACLLSEGEIEYSEKQYELKAEFKSETLDYLKSYVSEYSLQPYVEIHHRRNELVIQASSLENTYEKWYRNDMKIFSNRMDPKNMTFHAIILALNLFGVRKYESLHLKTSIQKEKLPMLTHILRYHIGDVSIVPGQREIKIFNVVQLFDELVDTLTVMDSFYLFRFLSVHDRKKLRA
ncbi:hypothetical protein [Priestia koreensis]|uniref:hypothetical protein n=1 Tax=Priestia koreensis TaxID=284581 RepID=UPI001F5A15C7|nr:hypothetical protein [Priestia koreensis]UNL87438.1 hypothetical protein IE339_24280 [Priestia koreensis]